MQYKIPVQIENEDPILLWMSLRQLTIVMAWMWIGYVFFKSLESRVGAEIALIPSVFFVVVAFVIALFKQYEMTFVPFILAALRKNINPSERRWERGIDSFQPIDIWYLASETQKVQEKIDFTSKMDKMQEMQEKLKKL